MASSCQTLLKKLGYEEIRFESNRIISIAINRTLLDLLGPSGKKAVLFHMCSSLQITEQELLSSNHQLLEKALYNILNTGANIILEKAKQHICKHIASIESTTKTFDEVVCMLQEREVLELIKKVPAHQHIAFLYEDEASKNKVIEQFLDERANMGAPRASICSKPLELKSVRTIMYDDLLMVEKSSAMEKLSKWLADVHKLNKSPLNNPTRILGEEDTWFLENGFEKEIISLEQGMGPKIAHNMVVLCTYGVNKLKEEHLRKIIESHGMIVIDNPFTIYKSKNNL